MNRVKSLVAPVCNVVQSNKQMLSTVLVLFVVTMMLPLDQLLRTNMKANLVSNLKGQMGMLTSVGSALLFLCLYFNNDTLNLVLLLYACVLLKLLN